MFFNPTSHPPSNGATPLGPVNPPLRMPVGRGTTLSSLFALYIWSAYLVNPLICAISVKDICVNLREILKSPITSRAGRHPFGDHFRSHLRYFGYVAAGSYKQVVPPGFPVCSYLIVVGHKLYNSGSFLLCLCCVLPTLVASRVTNKDT